MGEPRWGRAKRIAGAAISQYIDEVGDPYRIDHTVQVTSFGGAGTTALLECLIAAEVDVQRGPAQWPFKHWRWPPDADEAPPGFRVVYLVSDPRDAVLSIFRRDLQIGHYSALHDQAPSPAVAEHLADLETFLRNGVDLFGLADHVTRWREHPAGYPVLFVHYDHLDSEWGRVCDFVGLEDEPELELRPRRSDWRAAPAEVRDRLDSIYADVSGLVDGLAPSTLVP